MIFQVIAKNDIINIRVLAKTIITLLLSALFICGNGCSKKSESEEYLIKVRDRKITLSDFNQAVEAAGEEAFPGEQLIEPGALQQLRIEVLNQYTEQLVVLEYGKDLGIELTEAELEKTIAGIKADYPDNTFEETLLENAISFEQWKKKLASRLLVEKVITQELINQVQLSSEDISNYYNKLKKEETDDTEKSEINNENMVMQLRKLKAEVSYQPWIKNLKEQYPVEINRRQWEMINSVEN